MAVVTLLWAGVLGLVVPVVGRILGWFGAWTAPLIVISALGLGATILGVSELRRMRSVAFERWLQRQMAGDGE
jgi:predicted Na+-dependent transporter